MSSKRGPRTEETRTKIRNKLLGHTVSREAREKISKKNRGRTAWNKGKPWSESMKQRISETNKRKGIKPKKPFVGFGKEHPRWKGGANNIKTLDHRRRILEKEASGTHTVGEWETLKAQYNWTCPCCKKREPAIKLTEDHIVPLSRGGSHNIENIQPLCRSCNARKNNRHSTKYDL